jgi:uncharacterized membrane protein
MGISARGGDPRLGVKLRHPVVRGHPLHAMSTDLPIGIVPLALAASVAARARSSRGARSAADAAAIAAILSVAPAVLLGWWEWLTIPTQHEAHRPATTHGLVNSAASVLVLASFLRPWRVTTLGAACGLMAVGAWLGGDLVYRLGWRVRPAELLEGIQEGKTLAEAERALDEFERRETLLAP